MMLRAGCRLTCDVADRIYIIADGTVRYHGAADKILANKEILEYLI